MFGLINNNNKKGRPRKKRGLNNTIKEHQSDDYMKTIVLNVRVSKSEKIYLENLTKSKSDNISSYIRRLIFDIYFYKLKKKEDLIENIVVKGDYAFNEPRTEFIYVRLTEVEKQEVEKLAIMYHRNISEFIRWVSIQIPIDEIINY